MTEQPEIEVVVLDEDPGDVTFDERDTPLLQFERHPEHGPAWTLYYPEPDGNGVDSHVIGGRVEDLEWALAQAREHLAWVWSPEARP